MIARRRASRALASAALALLGAATAVPAAGATEISRSGGKVSVAGTQGRDRIGIELRPGATAFENVVVITERRSGLTVDAGAGARCVALSESRARCAVKRVRTVAGDGGADRIQLRSAPGLGAAASYVDGGSGNDAVADGRAGTLIFGGTGDDRIGAGGGGDRISGGAGADLVRGGAGNDEFSPFIQRFDTGRDTLLGGPGADEVDAYDAMRDRRIGCGRGRDFAKIDGRAPERADRDCERVKEMYRPLPDPG